MKAYKIFNHDWTCKNQKYEVGQTYEIKEKPVMCELGFHACKKAIDCFKYYSSVQWNKFAEVKMGGDVIENSEDSKVASNKITIVKELSFDEFIDVIKAEVTSRSSGMSGSSGTSDSSGTIGSYGTFNGRGITNCHGTSNSLFCVELVSQCFLFNRLVTEDRASEVRNNYDQLCNGWYPQFNNLHALYLKSGSKWECTPIPQAESIRKKEAWADIPKEAFEYLKSLPEFDAVIFEEITGIKT